MSLFLFNANDICRTRLCVASRCEDDAEHGSPLCSKCERRRRQGHRIALHQNPPQTGPLLWCGACRTDKPDDQFPMRSNHGKEPGRRQGMRRDRFWCCNECIARGRTK